MRLSPREMRRLMKRMGIELEDIGFVKEVIIRLDDKELVIKNPQVTVMKTRAGRVFQVMGEVEEKAYEPAMEKTSDIEIPEEDVQLVAVQAGVSPEEARKALMETGGDLAQAIILLNARKRV